MSIRVLDLSVKGAAYVAGVRVGDRINSINGFNVETPADIAGALHGVRTAQETPVRFTRNGVDMTRFMRVGRNNGGKLTRLGIVTDAALVGKHFGMNSVAAPQPKKAKKVVGAGTGVPVLRVKNGSVLTGVLRAGDILLSINGKALSRSEDVSAAVRGASTTYGSTVAFRRQGKRIERTAFFGKRPAYQGGVTRLGVITRPEYL